jgi:hypothetical protein
MKLENNVFMSELVYLSKNDLSKIKKQFRYDSNEERTSIGLHRISQTK